MENANLVDSFRIAAKRFQKAMEQFRGFQASGAAPAGI
jgi:hypothetical protein